MYASLMEWFYEENIARHIKNEFKNKHACFAAAARTLKEDKELLKSGFEYVTDRDGVRIYRKRK
jgi:predicted transcriptional regulator with HTH domain